MAKTKKYGGRDMMFITGLATGIWIGAPVGFIIAALMAAESKVSCWVMLCTAEVMPSPFAFARHGCRADGLKEALSPNQREDNPRARASLATVGSEGSRRGNLEHSESEPMMAAQEGNLAQSGKAR